MIRNAFWTGLMVFTFISTAFADGETRQATPGEKTDLVPPESVVPGQETFPMKVACFIKWQDDKRIDASKLALDQQLMKIAKNQSLDAKMKAYSANIDALAKEFGKAIEAKDNAKAEALQKEIDEAGKRFNEQASGNNQAIEQQIKDLTPHDIELRVNLSANVFYQELVHIPSEQTVLEGCPVIGVDDEDYGTYGWHEGTTYVFVGAFKYGHKDNTAAMQAEKIPGTAHTKVQTVVIAVQGEKNRAKGFIKQTNLKAVKALLGS